MKNKTVEIKQLIKISEQKKFKKNYKKEPKDSFSEFFFNKLSLKFSK